MRYAPRWVIEIFGNGKHSWTRSVPVQGTTLDHELRSIFRDGLTECVDLYLDLGDQENAQYVTTIVRADAERFWTTP